MPTTTTVTDVIELAYSKSMKTQPGVIATESTELLPAVIKAQRGLYSLAARVNPSFFAGQDDVPLAAGGWARPRSAESILRLEAVADTTRTGGVAIPAGREIVIVSWDDRRAEFLRPAVYQWGQLFRSAENAPDPVAGSLRFFYARCPDDPTALEDPLDGQWPEQYNELLALETAIYLAVKDSTTGRENEIAALSAERDRWVQLFVSFLEHEVAVERRRFGHVRRFNTNTMIPLAGAGGG